MLKRFKFLSVLILSGVTFDALAFYQLQKCISEQIITIQENNFKKDRALKDYSQAFAVLNFRLELLRLKPNDTWVDFGAGHGLAQLEYLEKTRFSRGKAVAISYKRPDMHEHSGLLAERFGKLEPGRFRYLEGRWLEDLEVKEFGPYKLGTDYFGPLSYSHRVDEVLQKYMDGMETDGRLYTVFASSRCKVITKDGKILPLNQWIGTIDGISMNSAHSETAFEITKTRNNVKIPRLKLESLAAGSPPYRMFTEI